MPQPDNRYNIKVPGRLTFLSRHPSALSPDPDWAQVVIVAQSGGDFTTIQAAIDSITDQSSTKRYTVLVMPGIYDEAVAMKSYVDVVGIDRKSVQIAGDGLSITVTGDDDCLLTNLTINPTDVTFSPLSNASGNNDFHVEGVDILGSNILFTSGRMIDVNIEGATSGGRNIINIGSNGSSNVPIFHYCNFIQTGAASNGEAVMKLTTTSSWSEIYHCLLKSSATINNSVVLLTAALPTRRQLMVFNSTLLSSMNHNDALNNRQNIIFHSVGEFYGCEFIGYALGQAVTPAIVGSVGNGGAYFHGCDFRGATPLTICSGGIFMRNCAMDIPIFVQLKETSGFYNCSGVTVDSLNASGSKTLDIVEVGRVAGNWTYTAGTWSIRLDSNGYSKSWGLKGSANQTFLGSDVKEMFIPPSALGTGLHTLLGNHSVMRLQTGGTVGFEIPVESQVIEILDVEFVFTPDATGTFNWSIETDGGKATESRAAHIDSDSGAGESGTADRLDRVSCIDAFDLFEDDDFIGAVLTVDTFTTITIVNILGIVVTYIGNKWNSA